MSYNVEVTAFLGKQLNVWLKKEYAELITSLKENPEQGINIGNNCYKIRLTIASKQKVKAVVLRLLLTYM